MDCVSLRATVMTAMMALAAACGGSESAAETGEGGGGAGAAASVGGQGPGGSGPTGGAGGQHAPLEEPTVGVVGCSITLNALNGYVALGGIRLWPVEDMGGGEGPGYPGGSVAGWVADLHSQGGRWLTLEALLSKYPQTEAIWWELCSSGPSADLDIADVAAVASAIRDRAPGVPIYASASPQFPGDDSLMCNENGGPAAMQSFVAELVAGQYVEAGPLLTPLTADQVAADGCHARDSGEQAWGQDLAGFFGLGGDR